MKKGTLAHLAVAGGLIDVRVRPNASSNRLVVDEGQIRIYVTTVPESGKATKAVIKILANALGIAKSEIELVRGTTSRDKVFRITSR